MATRVFGRSPPPQANHGASLWRDGATITNGPVALTIQFAPTSP